MYVMNLKSKKPNTYPKEILDQFRVVQRDDKRWVIALEPNRFLHWIELTTDKPVTISNPNLTRQSWAFKEEAEAIIDWLRRRWSEDSNVNAEMFEKISVTVKIEDE
jgi:hypothetical protein